MLLKVRHTTSYEYAHPVEYGLQELRLTPNDNALQAVRRWSVSIEGGTVEAQFYDQFQNNVLLISFAPELRRLVVHCEGEIETVDRAGVYGLHRGFVPLWLFRRGTRLTRPGPQLRRFLRSADAELGEGDDISRLHALTLAVRDAVAYVPGETGVHTSAEDALKDGRGVCQDHAHIFIAAARELGYPARYVSGYLNMTDRVAQEASHAWAEAFVEGLGWVGFDVSNGQSPDDHYIRLATGLDYRDATPMSGMRRGQGSEVLAVELEVEQQ